MKAWWWRFLLIGVLLAGGQQLVPYGLASYLAYGAIGMLGVTAMLVGVRRNRPTNRRAWFVLAAGNGAWLLADFHYNWYTHVLERPVARAAEFAFPVYLLAYLLLAAGLLLVVRGRVPGRQPTALLDTAILTVGMGLSSWIFLVMPAWSAPGVPVAHRLIGVAYPLCDVLLVAMGVRLMTGPGFWNASSRLLVGSLCALVLTNGFLLGAQFDAVIASHARVLDAGWLLAFALCGAAALHPSMQALSAPAPEREDTMLVGRLAALSAAVMAGPIIVTCQLLTGSTVHSWPIVIGSTILVSLVLVRMIRMVRVLKSQAESLSALAETDHITGLANRRGFADRLDEHLADPDPGEARICLVHLERFSDLNNTLGYGTGDAVLRAVAQRLVLLNGTGGMIARMGGDTFGILNLRPASDHSARAVALREALELPYQLPDLSVSVEVSLGIVAIPDDAVTPARALHRASVALVGAATRPGRIARYDAEMESGGTFSAVLIGQLRAALLRDEIVVHYQPQVEIGTGRVFGVEALVRWQHPEHGLLGPDTFIPGAEQTGLIGPLTHYVLDHALERCAAWRREGLDLTVAVNLSVRNLLDPGLIQDVRSTLTRHGLPASVLELEITEGTAMVDPKRSMAVLGDLAGLGITLSIDDYGTGHSSLAYLQRLPVKRLKIDRSFVTDLTTDAASATIVRSTVELARNLELEVIAEGVEDDVTLLALRDMQCYAAQGFGLGRPVAQDVLPALVRAIEDRIPELVEDQAVSIPA